MGHGARWPDGYTQQFDPQPVYYAGGFKADITYYGKTGDTIRLQYREFAHRPFYQDLSYDLAESRLVGFRGLTMEVIEATNTTIRFVVRTPARQPYGSE